MKWFKHKSTAHIDAKLKKVRHKYGLQGYGLYWYCVELIAEKVDENNTNFELEEDVETIAAEWGEDHSHIHEMMEYMIGVGLLEDDDGRITCLRLANFRGDQEASDEVV